MPKKIDLVRDIEILNYLKEHTYKETAAFFSISEKQITRIKARAPNGQSSALTPETKIQDKMSGPADREKNVEPTSPKRIEKEEPPKARKETVKSVTKLDANEILVKLQSKKIRDSPAYINLLKQLKDYGKKAIILELVNFINAEIL